MKKFIIAATALVVSSAMPVMAQSEYAPKAGDMSFEVRVDPFSGNDVFQLGDQAIKGRYFVTDNDAFLLQLGFGINKKSLNDLGSSYSKSEDSKYGNVRIDLGYERHFFNSGRIDLFAGLRVGYERKFASYESVEYLSDNINSLHSVTVSDSDRNGHFGGSCINTAVFTGIDFYVYKSLFVGAEFGLNVNKFIASDMETRTGNGTKSEIKSEPGTSELNVGVYIVPAFRLGWKF